LLRGILKQKNLPATYVNTLTDAQILLKKEKPSIVFLDNNLPDGKGVEFIDYVKKHCPETKVVMITAYDTYSDRQKALVEGADFFIGKPFTKDIIYNTVEKLIS
jgi:two-component SAPR family response regulator